MNEARKGSTDERKTSDSQSSVAGDDEEQLQSQTKRLGAPVVMRADTNVAHHQRTAVVLQREVS